MPENSTHPSSSKGRPFWVDVLAAFASLLLLTVLAIAGYTHYVHSKAILGLSHDLMDQTTRMVIDKTTNHLRPASLMAEMSSRIAQQGALSLTDRSQLESYTGEVLRSYPQLTMFYIGDEGGNFLMAKRQTDGTIATKIITRTAQKSSLIWKYRDSTGKVIKVEKSSKLDFDPRTRPWYQGAKQSRKTYWTDIYIFFTDQKPGITASHAVIGKEGKLLGVFGLDIELDQLSDFLRTLKVGDSGLAMIINQENQIVAHPDISHLVKEEAGSFRPARIDEIEELWVRTFFNEQEEADTASLVYQADGKKYIGSLTPFPASFGKNWKIALVVPEDDFVGPIRRTNQVSVYISLAILLAALLFALLLSRNISRPIALLTEETSKIKNFQLEGEVGLRSGIREVQMMSDGLSAMKTGLRAFGKYVPARLVRQLIETGEEARLGGQTRELTILFTDISGFTPISEAMSPGNLMLQLSHYFGELAKILIKYDATIDKYIGDGIMAFWGAPVEDPDHALHACQAALLCQEKLLELNRQWEQEGKSPLATRIGIHTGETVVGNIGSTDRMNYSALGDSVNVASRLEQVNKTYGTKIIVSQSTYQKVADEFSFRPLEKVAVRGRTQSIMVYELVGEKKQAE